MTNKSEILRKILLHMNYDSSKTLSENKEMLNEQYVKTVDIFGKPLAFYGKIKNFLGQELARTDFSYENNLSKEIKTMCYSSVGGRNSKGGDFDTLLRNCFRNNLNTIETFNINAPYTIVKDNHEYNLYFTCGEYGNRNHQTMQYEFYSMQCNKNNIKNVGYWSKTKDSWLPTIDLEKQKQYDAKKPEEKTLKQDLDTFEISATKSDQGKEKKVGSETKTNGNKNLGKSMNVVGTRRLQLQRQLRPRSR